MTGAGSATVAFTVESAFNAGPDATDPVWYQPGTDITVGDLSVENALQRVRNPDDATPMGSREGNFEGAASVQFTLTDDNWHALIPGLASGAALSDAGVKAPSSAWYFGVDIGSGSEARTPTGAVVIDASVNYQEGQNVTVELTIIYADESDHLPGEIVQPSVDQVYTHHGTDLIVDTVGQSMLQSATLSMSNLARFRPQQDRHPYDAVVGAIEPSFQSAAIFDGPDQLELAYGGTTPSDTVDTADGTLTFENGLAETIEYSLTDLQPTSYSWDALVDPDTDLTEPITYHVADVGVV